MWFITLLVVGVAAVLIIKAVSAHSARRASVTDDLPQTSGVQGTLQSTSTAESGIGNQQGDSVNAENTTPNRPSTPETSGPVDRQSTLEEIRELIKIINLAASDSPRLGISAEEFNAIKAQDDDETSIPDSAVLADVVDRLRRMSN